MEKTKNFFKDFVKSMIIGCIAALALATASGLVLLIVYRGNVMSILQGIKVVLLFTGAAGLILTTGFIIKTDARRPLDHINEWKQKFRTLNFVSVIFIAAITILIIGIIFDNFLFKTPL